MNVSKKKNYHINYMLKMMMMITVIIVTILSLPVIGILSLSFYK